MKKFIALMMAAVLAVTPVQWIHAEEITAGEEILVESEEGSLTEIVGTENTEENLIEEELYIDVTQSDVLVSEQKDSGSTDPEESDASADTVLIESVQEVPTKDYVAEDVAEVYSEVFTEKLADCGLASDADMPAISLFSNTEYTDSYGKQLDGDAYRLYVQLVDAYVTQRGSKDLTYTFETPFTFTAEGTIEKDENGKNYVNWDSEKCEEYQEIKAQIAYIVQSAYGALVYDYPEVFWIEAPYMHILLHFTEQMRQRWTVL